MNLKVILGGLIVVVGAGIWIGNVSGAFRTIPFLGWILILVGGAVVRAGINE